MNKSHRMNKVVDQFYSATNQETLRESLRQLQKEEVVSKSLDDLLAMEVRAWDPDFTKVTSSEAVSMENAERSGYVEADEIDWNNLEKML